MDTSKLKPRTVGPAKSVLLGGCFVWNQVQSIIQVSETPAPQIPSNSQKTGILMCSRPGNQERLHCLYVLVKTWYKCMGIYGIYIIYIIYVWVLVIRPTMGTQSSNLTITHKIQDVPSGY